MGFPVLADTEREASKDVSWKDVPMPVRYPDEFRQQAIELARPGDKPVARIAADLGIAPSCLPMDRRVTAMTTRPWRSSGPRSSAC